MIDNRFESFIYRVVKECPPLNEYNSIDEWFKEIQINLNTGNIKLNSQLTLRLLWIFESRNKQITLDNIENGVYKK